MNGSKTINERLKLLDELDKIIFVSKWVQNRFFEKLMNNGDIDLYMCGDDHNKQIIKKKEVFRFFRHFFFCLTSTSMNVRQFPFIF